MCGIFGAALGDTRLRKRRRGEQLVERLFVLSESRGKEAAGLALADDLTVKVLKAPVPARTMIRSAPYRNLIRQAFSTDGNGLRPGGTRGPGHLVFIGHSRLVTDGIREVHENNQPVLTSGIVGIHNGIVVNDEALWARHPKLR